jgi:serine/threonine protein kinase/tetratricopeptide (TPR) repeat protein
MNSEPDPENLFLEARELNAVEREAFLARTCAGDPSLRARIEKLLADEASADAYFADTHRSGRATINPASELPSAREGQRIGRYKLLQQIGEGGFGSVWMAEQTEPLTRRVALKVIKFGMDTREVIARFEAERQALAMMEHPNIAKVFDAGATEKGRPYFVMELVKGMPLTEFCDARKLDTRERLELFSEICSALSHAHQKGIIHRDLKPSNILVTLHGDKPVPKIIDFGIAKATQSKLTEHTLFTRFEQFVGTPVYMSPEQAALSGLDIDTRSDIYSLGVLLYELLTGKPPFDARSLLSAGYDEMRRIIREEEPPKPSTRVGTLLESERTGLASTHRADVDKLGRLLRGDLDWIIMKALEKDRSRRYATADAMALDIHRYLHDEPVEAAAPSAIYRFRKFARRHRRSLGVAATVLILLLVGIATTSWQAIRATLANRALENQIIETTRERGRAEANFLLARKAVDDYLLRIANDPRLNSNRLQPLRRQLLEDALAYYGKFLETEAADPELAEAAFHARYQIGFIQNLVGSKDEAIASLHAAIAELQATGTAAAIPGEVATCHYSLGFIHLDLDRYAEAESAFESSRGLRERILAEDPENAEWIADLAASYNALGITMNKSYRPERALDLLGMAISQGERLIAAHPERVDALSDLGSCFNNLADSQRLLGRGEESVQSLREAIEYQQAAVAKDPGNPQYLDFLANHHFNLGVFLSEHGDAEGRTMLENALRERERLVAHDPTITEWQFLLARTCLELGSFPATTPEDQEAARKQLERAAEILGHQLEINPMWNDARGSLARTRHLLALNYRSQGRGDKALEAWQNSANLSESLIAEDPINAATHRSNFARSLYFAGHLLSDSGENGSARQALERSRDAYERLLADGSKDPTHLDNLAHCLNRLGLVYKDEGRREEALTAYDKAIVLLEGLRNEPSHDISAEILLGGVHCNKGHLLSATTDLEEALAAYALAEAALRHVLSVEPENGEAAYYLFNTISGKAAALVRADRLQEAVKACAAAAESAPEAFRPSFRLRLAYYAALAGDTVRSLHEVDALVGKVRFDDGAKRDLASVYAIAAAAARENDAPLAALLTERALQQLASCLREGLFDQAAIEAESDFDALRDEPGYHQLFETARP